VTAWASVTQLLGGLGLFLLGMSMMTDGLKLAAGPSLERLLARATRTRLQALATGIGVTALVQSSSAVTVAAIGFVNAGMLALVPALWVLFGANVGTTMTGWIVALVGLKLKVDALALPLIGAGALLQLTGQRQRRGALGGALAGFGLLFFGIALLQASFVGLASEVDLPAGTGLAGTAAQVGVGVLMTVLMQSSSASMAIALTAAAGGLLTTEGAAAVVIGANIGTTTTALIAAIGSTSNARRAAVAHLVFNALTGLVAFALLPWLVEALSSARRLLGLAADPASTVALFHTCFNFLGVLLMWPIADALARWLQRRFVRQEEDEARPRYLDDNVLTVPALAVVALQRELRRLSALIARAGHAALAGADGRDIERDRRTAEALGAAIDGFVERMSRGAMSAAASQRLAQLLRVQRYLESATEQVAIAAVLPGPGPHEPSPMDVGFRRHADRLLDLSHGGEAHVLAGEPGYERAADAARVENGARAGSGDAPQQDLDAALGAMDVAYQLLKSDLLQGGATGRLRVAEMEQALRRISALRRAAKQTAKAATLLRASDGRGDMASPATAA